MWKTKLAYIALGAFIASIGYFVGTFNNLNAEDEVARVEKLIVSEEIITTLHARRNEITESWFKQSNPLYHIITNASREEK